MLKIIHAPRTDELQPGDAVVWNNGETYLFDRFEADDDAPGSYGRVYWDRGTWSTTAQPWNTWSAAIRAA